MLICKSSLMQLAGWPSGPEATGHQGEWLSPGSGDCAGRPMRLITWPHWSIDQQLQPDSNLRMVEYQMLSTSAQRTIRTSSLAEVTNASLSRLSHLVQCLEQRSLVRRE